MAKDKVSASHEGDIPPGLRSKTSHDALVLSTAPGKAHYVLDVSDEQSICSR